MAALVVLIFYSVSGGAYGIEEIVKAGGPFYALIGFSLFLVWAIPEALITAELSTALPESSGGVAWVAVAFGSYWGFEKGWLSYLSGVADNSLYPILLFDYVISFLNGMEVGTDEFSTGWTRWLCIVMMALVLTYLNYRGLDVVGNTAIVLCVVSVLPLLAFCVIGAFQVDPARWLVTPVGGLSGVDWKLFLNTFFWNINYWESSACYAGDVKNPGKTYPKALAWAVGLVALSTFVPILVGTGASAEPSSKWQDGFLSFLAVEIGGQWLGTWMTVGAMVSSIGMFEAEMSSDAWQLAGMAERGIIPKFMGTRNAHGTPTYGILLSASGVLVLCWLSFAEVIEMLNILYCIAQLIEFAAFVHLRVKYPNMHRPFRIPLGTVGVSVMLAAPALFVLLIIGISSVWAVMSAFALAFMGFFVAMFLETAEQQEWCVFENMYEESCPSLHEASLPEMAQALCKDLELEGYGSVSDGSGSDGGRRGGAAVGQPVRIAAPGGNGVDSETAPLLAPVPTRQAR
jgi:amino acid transporter